MSLPTKSQRLTEPTLKPTRGKSDLFHSTWIAALGCFILAGTTGALLRFGVLYGFPAGLQFADLRHAHSHLMYFGWVTPALMGLMVAWLPRLTGRPIPPRLQTLFRYTLGTIFLLALPAYVSFLFYGYRPAEIGGRRLPLSTIAAGLNVLAWYGFVVLYWRATRGAARVRPLRLWDAALAFLVLASGGAWGVALVSVLAVDDPVWVSALTHLFLDLFAEGWFVLAVLGLAYAAHPHIGRQALARRSEGWLIMGLPVIFLLGMPVSTLPPAVRLVASLGGVLVALGLAGNIIALWPVVGRGWRVPLAFLGLKAVAGLAMTVPAAALWAQRASLRISYLHWLLLGFVTLGLVAAAQTRWGRAFVPGRRWWTLAVILLLLTLIPLTRLWPPAWSGRWLLVTAAWAALGPVTVAVGSLAIVLRRRTMLA